MRLFLITALIVHAAAAEVSVVDGFPKAREASGKSGRPLAVLVYGSDWHRASRTFATGFWQAAEFRAALESDFVLSAIDVPQNLDEEGRKAFDASVKGWDRKSVRSYPAIQIYGPDGHLLKTLSGRELREVSLSPATVAAQVDLIGRASRERDRLLREISELKDKPDEIAKRIDALNGLPIAPEKDAVKTFTELDPSDASGWAARLAFKDWEFIRGITGRIGKGETEAALTEVEAMLANDAYTPQQRCLILAAQGMLLTAIDRKDEAWEVYLQAWRLDPDGPNGKAVIRHGWRGVGKDLRAGVSPDSPRFGRSDMKNLTRGHAELTLSSSDPQSDHKADHASLFDGPMKDFAFHTREENAASATIDLGDVCQIDVVQILNRPQLKQRAAGLTLWLSEDGNSWKSCWQAETPAASWEIELAADGKPAPKARYLKLSLPGDRPGILHLRAVNAFGERP
ncbi:hypothetical protein HAHE_19430 [Haloferula helveola]|uniref:F5/8 type C domain-containing protein n=1 Tax=Haloferula helveola TaxID=490095 RepID=A0ABM7REC7_9BACT|nr:hypothetical protein HAHE_19430 [Haloferula helveola]